MGIQLSAIFCFSFFGFNICSLCLIFVSLINMCLVVFHLGFILFGARWVSWIWVTISFPILGIFQLLSPQLFSYGLSFCLLLLGQHIGAFNIVPEVPEVVLISFNSFFLFSSLLHLFLPFYLLPHLSYLLPPLFYFWFPPEYF